MTSKKENWLGPITDAVRKRITPDFLVGVIYQCLLCRTLYAPKAEAPIKGLLGRPVEELPKDGCVICYVFFGLAITLGPLALNDAADDKTPETLTLFYDVTDLFRWRA